MNIGAADATYHESMNVRVVNSMYHRGRGGWQELFDYGGIRYHARLFPSLDGNGIQDDTLRLLARASEENDDIMDDYGDECRRLIWPLIEQDYALRSESEKTDLSPSKATVRLRIDTSGPAGKDDVSRGYMEKLLARKLYAGASTIWERHRHRYEVNAALVNELSVEGFNFIGEDDSDEKGERMQVLELESEF